MLFFRWYDNSLFLFRESHVDCSILGANLHLLWARGWELAQRNPCVSWKATKRDVSLRKCSSLIRSTSQSNILQNRNTKWMFFSQQAGIDSSKFLSRRIWSRSSHVRVNSSLKSFTIATRLFQSLIWSNLKLFQKKTQKFEIGAGFECPHFVFKLVRLEASVLEVYEGVRSV